MHDVLLLESRAPNVWYIGETFYQPKRSARLNCRVTSAHRLRQKCFPWLNQEPRLLATIRDKRGALPNHRKRFLPMGDSLGRIPKRAVQATSLLPARNT